MCTEEQHQEKIALLHSIKEAVCSNWRGDDIDSTMKVTPTQPLILDYRGRRHIFVYSAASVSFKIEDLGSIVVPANTWTDVSFEVGNRLVPDYAVTVLVRCTDEYLLAPAPLVDNIPALVAAGKAYYGTTGILTGPASTNQTVAFSFFVPSSVQKDILLYSLRLTSGGGSVGYVQQFTTDPALANAASVANRRVGGPVSVLTSVTYANTNTAFAGNSFDVIGLPTTNATVEALSTPVFIPARTNFGIEAFVFLASASTSWGATAYWVEI